MDTQKIGNSEKYSFEHLQVMENSPLLGKKICILGSSVAYGSASEQCAVGEYLAARLGASLSKETVSGTTLTDLGPNSYVQRMLNNISTEEKFDLFICQLSTNDTRGSLNLPLGEPTSEDRPEAYQTDTIAGAIEYIISYSKRTWNCPVVFFTGSRFESKKYGEMVELLLKIQKKWGIGVLDLWTDNAFNAISDEQRSLYMIDPVHPVKAGYRDWWGPEMERQLMEYWNQ